MEKAKIGIVGCGAISHIYIKNLTDMFSNTEVFAICDLDANKTEEAKTKYGITNILTLDEMLASEVDIILNLTTPGSHYGICKKALMAGKHTYVEKPLSLQIEEGRELVELAGERNLMLGCAPDTFLGAGIQKCIDMIKSGEIGEVVSSTAYMMCHGHESWHPNPEFYYKKGGGPMFDMGPYYLTALVNLIGPVKSVMGMTKKTFDRRTITSKEKNGQIIEVDVPTHINGIMEFENGAIGNIITSFDVWGHHLPNIEIHGSKGSLKVPDPNGFNGEIMLKKGGDDWVIVDNEFPYKENSRGLGVSDMVEAINLDVLNQCNGVMALHVLELMHGFHISADTKKQYEVVTRIIT